MGKEAMMSGKEVQRYALIAQVLEKTLSQADAACALGLSVRQIKRLCRAVRQHGVAGLISARRGQPSKRRIPADQQAHFMGLVHTHYADFGPELAREYLQQNHGFTYSTETLRGWMVQDGLWKARPRKVARAHPPRERRPRRGELVQIDGSHHDWFEGRAPKCCLIAFIDDATGEVLGGGFSPTETTQAYFDVLHRYVQDHGVPVALYSDRHSIFTKHNSSDAVPTQFERALLQMDIAPIHAYSPQAKGRVERLFQTLQDRLIKAMRLQGINSMDEANAWLDSYLHEHNQRFAISPREPSDAHRPCTKSAQELQHLFALHHQRQLNNQLNCQFEGSVVQVHPGQAHAPKGRAQVDIVEFGDGNIELLYRGKVLKHTRYAVQTRKGCSTPADDKRINAEVDRLMQAQHMRIARVAAQIRHQDAQRAQGIRTPAHPSAAPRAATARYRLRPSQSVPEHSTA